MDVPTMIALALGVIGVVVGSVAWGNAREAKALAAGASRLAQELTRAATDASRTATEATAAATARAAPGPPAAQEADAPGPAVPIDERAAKIVVRSGSTPGQDLPTNQGSGSGLIGIFVVNQGPVVARNLRLSAAFPTGAIRRSGTHHSLSAHKEMTLFAQVSPQDFGAANSVDVLYRVAYRDGNGEHELAQKVRVEGGWKGPWKTFLEEDGAGHSARQRGAAAAVPAAEID